MFLQYLACNAYWTTWKGQTNIIVNRIIIVNAVRRIGLCCILVYSMHVLLPILTQRLLTMFSSAKCS